jgi:hypothetical protein
VKGKEKVMGYSDFDVSIFWGDRSKEIELDLKGSPKDSKLIIQISVLEENKG